MKSYQFFTDDGRGGTMLCDDDTLDLAVSELTKRFKGVVRVQIGKEVWLAENSSQSESNEVSATLSQEGSHPTSPET